MPSSADYLMVLTVLSTWCFVNDTSLFIKPNDTGRIHQTLSNFDKCVCFTIDPFENAIPHILDLEIQNGGIALYKKPTKYWLI